MNPKHLKTRLDRSDRGVSPVIGVILMVAITVILAAVIGTFVLDLGQSTGQTAPQASLQMSDADDELPDSPAKNDDLFIINHQGGDSIEANNLIVQVRNVSDNSLQAQFDGGVNSTTYAGNITVNRDSFSGDAEFATGDSLEIIVSGANTGTWTQQEYVIQVIDKESDQQVSSATVEIR